MMLIIHSNKPLAMSNINIATATIAINIKHITINWFTCITSPPQRSYYYCFYNFYFFLFFFSISHCIGVCSYIFQSRNLHFLLLYFSRFLIAFSFFFIDNIPNYFSANTFIFYTVSISFYFFFLILYDIEVCLYIFQSRVLHFLLLFFSASLMFLPLFSLSNFFKISYFFRHVF